MNKKEVIKILSSIGYTFFSVIFTKNDGEERKLKGRLGVKKYLTKGGDSNLEKGLKVIKDKYIVVYDMVKKGYRMINIETISMIKANGNIYK